MYVTVVPNRGSRPAILLRESYREGGKVKYRTLKNMSDWPAERIELLRGVLRGRRWCRRPRVSRSCGPCRTDTCPRRSARRAGSGSTGCCRAGRSGGEAGAGDDRGAADRAGRQARDGAAATKRRRRPTRSARPSASARSTRRSFTPLSTGWAGLRPAIEKALAKRHLEDGCLVLYDVTSSYLEGPLLRHWRASATAATVGATGRRSSSGCCAPPTAARSPSRCSKAIPPIRARSPAQVAKIKRALRAEARRAGRRPRPDHQRPHRGRTRAGRARLDHRAARAGDPGARRRRRPAAALAVRRARHGRDRIRTTIRASASSSAATRSWRPSARASAANCSPPPSGARSASRPRIRAQSQAAPRQGQDRLRRSAPCSAAARWPSTSDITISDDDPALSRDDTRHRRRGGARRLLCAAQPPCRPRPSMPPPPCARLQEPRLRSNAPSERQRPSTSISARSSIGPARASAPTSSCACSPTTSNGTCVRPSPRCCSTTTTAPPPRLRRASPVAKAKPSRRRQAQGREQAHRRRPCPSTASEPSSQDLATLTRNTVRFGRDHTTELLATPTRYPTPRLRSARSRACTVVSPRPNNRANTTTCANQGQSPFRRRSRRQLNWNGEERRDFFL